MRSICIHGHFYQPPREDPWTGRIPAQASAAPFHDWNERIAEECYAPNASNYGRISFNFGPTLLHWFETERSGLLRDIAAADREARLRFGGHGPALAQAWGHAILPLCTSRDRRTQVLWGMREFALISSLNARDVLSCLSFRTMTPSAYGTTSSNKALVRSCASTAACRAAPRATQDRGSPTAVAETPKTDSMVARTLGENIGPPTKMSLCDGVDFPTTS